MKLFYRIFVCCIVTLIMTGLVVAQDVPTDRLSVPFSDPSRPGLVKVGLVNGGITVKGYNGKEVLVEAKTSLEKIDEPDEPTGKAKGMRKLQYTATGLSIEEENNVMDIDTKSWGRPVDVSIKVPRNTSLTLKTVNDGDIYVEDVVGEIEVNNVNGGVELKNVSGAVVAHALNDDLIVDLEKVESKKSMSFSSLNGDIDVTLPANIKANFKMKSDNGDIYSDFEINMKASSAKPIVEDARNKGGKYKVEIDEYLYGTVNGGGPEIIFKTFQGDIFIRKGK